MHNLSATTKKLIAQFKFSSIIIWGAMSFSIIPLFIVAYTVTNQQSTEVDKTVKELESILSAVAVLLGIVSIMLHKHFLSDAKLKAKLKREVSAEMLVSSSRYPNQADIDAQLSNYESLSAYERKIIALMRSLFVPLVISCALNESIAIFGFVLSILQGEPAVIVPYAAGAILLNIMVFPRNDKILKRAERLRLFS